MTQPASVPVMLKHPTDPKLCGPVTFRLPDAFVSIAIGRRLVELANIGRDPKLPRIHPEELPIDVYVKAVMVATLEHVITAAPAGLYREVNGRPMLAPGALTEFEAEEPDGAIKQLYAAYEAWRSSFRLARARNPQGDDDQRRSEDDSVRGPESPEKPAGSPGDTAGNDVAS